MSEPDGTTGGTLVEVAGDRLRVRAGRLGATDPLGRVVAVDDAALLAAFPEVAEHVAAALRAPVATVVVRHADARGEGRLAGWCSTDTAVMALAAGDDGWQDLVARPVATLPALLARLLGVGPRAGSAIGRTGRTVQRDAVGPALVSGALTARWTIAVDRPPRPPGVVSVLDGPEGYWAVDADGAALRLEPWTPAHLWDALAAACALPAAPTGV
jgi:hypothetical protein